MYHPYRKDSSYLRDALYKEYKHKCRYCGIMITQIRNMHVDHILPSNKPNGLNKEIKDYINELLENGFIQDSIENYFPTCPSCNMQKSNKVFSVSSLRYYHEIAMQHTDNILRLIEKENSETEYFYEPVDNMIWKQLDFSYQRGISYAVMGYRLSAADVVSCPEFPQVERCEKQLDIVDYAFILGETGCGKSISLFQTGYRFAVKGWKVYLLDSNLEIDAVSLPENTEKSLYLIDDAQIYSSALIKNICDQARPNRKVLIAKTISKQLNSDSIVLTNTDAVNIMYCEFLKRKDEIWPIVKKSDRTVGVSMLDMPIERRLETARDAETPWQFNYILRGGWNSMHELYSSVVRYKNCDLLAATIAAFQILYLDQATDLNDINMSYEACNFNYCWKKQDVDFLVGKRIVLSEEEMRIVHLESANVIISMFFAGKKRKEQSALLHVIENKFKSGCVSPLGIVWLCNGSGRYLRPNIDSDDLFITNNIKKCINEQIRELRTSEDIRNMMFLLAKTIIAGRKHNGDIGVFNKNENVFVDMLNGADSMSAFSFSELLNTLFNHNKNLHNSFSNKVDWNNLMQRMMEEDTPDYYSWGKLFNRGISLLKRDRINSYREKMLSVIKWVISKATVSNIDQITSFICLVAFLRDERIHDLMQSFSSTYKDYFETNMEKGIYIFDYDFLAILCGIGILRSTTPTDGQKQTANMVIQAIPIDKLAEVVSKCNLQDWFNIRNILDLILTYDDRLYVSVIHKIDLQELSDRTNYSWNDYYEICLILDCLYRGDKTVAKQFIEMNRSKIQSYYSTMIVIDTEGAIKASKDYKIPLEFLTDHWWDMSLAALKAMYSVDPEFTKKYLDENAKLIAEQYSNVTALDFTERDSIDILKLIQKISLTSYKKVMSMIDKEKVLENWDKCSGIEPRKKRWIAERKKTFLTMIE